MRAPPSARLEVGPLVAAAGLLVGLVLGERAGPGPARSSLLAGSVALVTAWLLTGRARVPVAALAMALLGAASMQSALAGLSGHALVADVSRGSDVWVRGTLATDPQGPRFAADALVRIDDFSPEAGRGGIPIDSGWREVDRTVLARASGDEAGRLRVLAAGDRVVLRGRLGPLEGFDSRRRWQHGVALLSRAEVHAFAAPRGGVLAVANRLRSAVLRGSASLAATDRALIAGFLLGDTREIPREVADEFRASGLSHLLAVSGANVAFALAVVRPALNRFGIGMRFFGGLAVVVLFAAMTRFEPSVMRASAMAAVSLFAGFVGRPASAVRLLAIAVVALMLADPFLIHSVAFALSCGACVGIALLASPLADRLPGPRWLREPFAVTVAAQAGVTPVLLPVFGSLPAVSPLANLLAVPVADFLGVFGLPAGVLGGLLGDAVPGLRAALNVPAAASVRWIGTVARVSARVPLEIDGRTLAFAAPLAAAWALSRAARRARRAPGSLPDDAGDAPPEDPPGR
ncbi:MAG: ComEC/Rec2 family competence protein [Acidimicrobiia bacterium]|nr:ComEC/Rec2 family competence protein [Acidimicrobiia bacterium]